MNTAGKRRFDDHFLEDLKGRLRLSEVIGRSVKLTRRGREFVGLSPFAKEKTPSFYVNDDKGFFHDFSSGKHGDLIAFLQEAERLTFVEAVERLASEAGVSIPARDPAAERQAQQRRSLADLLSMAAEWYSARLRSPAGAVARDHLAKRGLSEAEWSRFGLGYAPAGRTELKDYMIAKGATAEALIACGLLVDPTDRSAPFDRFRDRIMFPITNPRGDIVSFAGRALEPKARAKYLNGPETAIFDKGRNLYGLSLARPLIEPAGGLVVVEGYFDVIACQRAGLAAVAPMGTALTEAQMGLLWRCHREPTLCFDGDAAGRRAGDRAIERALPLIEPGRTFRFAAPQGKDADEILRSSGADALRRQLAATEPFASALFARELRAEPIDTPERRTGLRRRLIAAASSIRDRDLAAAYRAELLERFSKLRAQATTPAGASAGAKVAAERLANSLAPSHAALAIGAILLPEALDAALETVASEGFGDTSLADLAQQLVAARMEHPAESPSELARRMDASTQGQMLPNLRRLAAASAAPFLTAEDRPAAVRAWSATLTATTRLEACKREIARLIEQAGDPNAMAELRSLKGERDRLMRDLKSGAAWAT